MRRHRLVEWAQIAVLAAMFLAAAIRWPSVPDRIPIHWNAAGEVDGYGGRFVGLLLVPLISVAIYLLLRLLPRIDPARANYESFAGTYLLIRVVLLVYLAVVYLVVNLAVGDETSVPVGQLILGLVAVMYIVLGAVMGKIRPNWFVGIRTPWTLSSKLSWTRTHRLGGWVFIGCGLTTMIAAIFAGHLAVYLMLGVLLVGVVGLVVYSYVVWRNDPDRVPASEVTPASHRDGR